MKMLKNLLILCLLFWMTNIQAVTYNFPVEMRVSHDGTVLYRKLTPVKSYSIDENENITVEFGEPNYDIYDKTTRRFTKRCTKEEFESAIPIKNDEIKKYKQ